MNRLAYALALLGAPAMAEAPVALPCRVTEVSRSLDFWVGDWDVYVGKDLSGRDTVERILGGCGVLERWDGGAGDQGMSLFAYDARKDLWTQTWVTGDSSVPGGIKFKVLRAHALQLLAEPLAALFLEGDGDAARRMRRIADLGDGFCVAVDQGARHGDEDRLASRGDDRERRVGIDVVHAARGEGRCRRERGHLRDGRAEPERAFLLPQGAI